MNSKSVLLIDDDMTTRGLFEAVLSYHDIDLLLAESESEALEVLSRSKPDIIVLDIVLPGKKDGYNILRRIRALPGVHCPVVATTAYYSLDSVPQFERKGFDGHLLKPIRADALVSYLEEVMASFN